MLECLSIIEKMQFSEYHAHIAEAFQFRDELMRWLQPILTTKGETQEKE